MTKKDQIASIIHEMWKSSATNIINKFTDKIPDDLRAGLKDYNDLSKPAKKKYTDIAEKIISIAKTVKLKTKDEFESESVKPLVNSFCNICESHLGFKPMINYSIEIPLLRNRLKTIPTNEMEQLFNWFVKSQECKSLGCTLKIALSNFIINKWLQSKAKKKFNI